MIVNKQIKTKRTTTFTVKPLYFDCPLENTSTKQNKYVVNQKLEHVDDISSRELFGKIRVVAYKVKCVPS
jgi:hypothetical protein